MAGIKGMTDPRLLPGCLRLAIDLAATERDLRDWWTAHRAILSQTTPTQFQWLTQAAQARRDAIRAAETAS